jgi:hypothetical protein
MSLSTIMAEDVQRRADSRSGAALAGTIDQKAVDDALSTLTKYIPTEVLTLYLPALAVAAAVGSQNASVEQKGLYWVFGLLVTPLAALGMNLRKRAVAGLPIWPGWDGFPLWALISASMAFLAWSLAIPGNPYIDRPALNVVSAFVALFASTILSFIEPFVMART